MNGQLITIIGPSGVGKDSILQALKLKCPDIHVIRRVITRSEDVGNEEFISVSKDEFDKRKAQGQFAFSWSAHGLSYGIPNEFETQLQDGKTVIFNGSRAALSSFEKKYPRIKTILITATNETLASRLSQRGRETADDIKNRLQRASYKIPSVTDLHVISNDGALEDALDQLIKIIIPTEESV